jgi:hypothetical protein
MTWLYFVSVQSTFAIVGQTLAVVPTTSEVPSPAAHGFGAEHAGTLSAAIPQVSQHGNGLHGGKEGGSTSFVVVSLSPLFPFFLRTLPSLWTLLSPFFSFSCSVSLVSLASLFLWSLFGLAPMRIFFQIRAGLLLHALRLFRFRFAGARPPLPGHGRGHASPAG